MILDRAKIYFVLRIILVHICINTSITIQSAPQFWGHSQAGKEQTNYQLARDIFFKNPTENDLQRLIIRAIEAGKLSELDRSKNSDIRAAVAKINGADRTKAILDVLCNPQTGSDIALLQNFYSASTGSISEIVYDTPPILKPYKLTKTELDAIQAARYMGKISKFAIINGSHRLLLIEGSLVEVDIKKLEQLKQKDGTDSWINQNCVAIGERGRTASYSGSEQDQKFTRGIACVSCHKMFSLNHPYACKNACGNESQCPQATPNKFCTATGVCIRRPRTI